MQGENERQWKKSERKKRVTKKFLEVSRCSRAKQRQRNVQKSVLIRPIVACENIHVASGEERGEMDVFAY